MDWPAHRGVEESRRFLSLLERSRFAGREAPFAVIERRSDELVGICALVMGKIAGSAELGYASRRRMWGHGYMTEAVQLICPWAFEHLKLHSIYAEAHFTNLASQRVLEKSGFTREPNPVSRTIKGTPAQHHRYRLDSTSREIKYEARSRRIG